MKMLLHIYCGTRFSVLDIIILYLRNKNAEPRNYFIAFSFIIQSNGYNGLKKIQLV